MCMFSSLLALRRITADITVADMLTLVCIKGPLSLLNFCMLVECSLVIAHECIDFVRGMTKYITGRTGLTGATVDITGR